MARRFLFGVSLAALLAVGGAAEARTQQKQEPQKQQKQEQQKQDQQKQEQSAQSVSGTIKSIGSDRRSFTLEVGSGDSKQTMDFVLDDKAQVQGRVAAGAVVAVTFHQGSDGKNVALTISAQS